jgi:hypothetical protein
MVDASLKQRALEVMEQLPPNATVEDLMERFCATALLVPPRATAH